MPRYSDLSPDVLRGFRDHIVLFSTVLFRTNQSGDPEQFGSGTFVRLGKQSGILTAGHVIAGLEGASAVAMLHRDVGSQAFINRDVLDMSLEYRSAESLPDIGFIRLPPEAVATIEAGRRIFYNLEAKHHAIREVADGTEITAWALCGAPGEFTTYPNEAGGVVDLSSFVGFTDCEHLPDVGTWDAVQAKVSYRDLNPENPRDMRGMSGGGLWAIRAKPGGGYEYLLCGVACFQSDIVDELRTVTCHGPRSVLEYMHRITTGSGSNPAK